ncbi:MAG TPA: gluconate 2-dehydrogenase subunit 3 family protein [Pseudolabrys sp.]|nr:gluconate 2-dehydrogenase subunit 3 family protein [Pseudolabrys sp.]
MGRFSRRDLLRTAGAAGAAAAVTHVGESRAQYAPPAYGEQPQHAALPRQPGHPEAATASPIHNENVLFFFNQDEAKFVRAAVDRLIPADEKWGGAEAAGVLYYIDHQLAGAYGAGARMYLKGPWQPDAPYEQGYQLKYSPADLYHVAIAEIRHYVRKQHGNKEFWDLSSDDMDKALKAIESGEAQLSSIPSEVFFETLLANTIEGYFCDPAYGGNRDMVSWRMIGFPGAYAQYVGLVDQFGVNYTREPLSIASSYVRMSEHKQHG